MGIMNLSASSRRRRWSDSQRQWGPFTLATSDYRNFGVVLDSGGDGYDDGAHCHLRLRGFGCTLIVELPPIIKPWNGPEGCWDRGPHSREYGFDFGGDGFFRLFFGAQTHDSKTTQMWATFLPWTQWRHIRTSMFDASGEHWFTEWSRPRGFAWRDNWAAHSAATKTCPAVVFDFDDFDGERIRATTRIEEREWKFGAGWFRWLSLFRRPRVRRSLDIDFSAEVGPEKGSWKGGTLGHGIEMQPGEMHEEAFRRYCEQEHSSKYKRFRITFVGRVAPEPPSDDQRGAAAEAT